MGSPAIFNGSFTKLLTSRAIVQSNGQVNEQNGPINYINNYGAEIDTSNWTTYSDNQTATMTTATPTVVTITSTTGLLSGMPITFTNSGGALPTGVSAATTYWVTTVINSTTFRFSASLGGSDVAVSGAGSGVNTYRPLVPITTTSSALTGLTFSRNTTTPLRGSGDLKLAQTNSTVVAGQGIYYPFTIDSADKGKVLTIKFDFNADANFSAANGTTTPNAGGTGDSDIEVYIFDVTGGVLIPVSPQVISANGTNNFTFSGVFQTGSTNTSYRLCLHAAKFSASATGYNFRADNVFVGPQTAPLGVPVTDWKSFTPTGSFTNVTYAGFYRRYGDSGQIRIRMSFTGAPATQATLTLNYLPPGWTLDTTKMTSTATDGSVVMGSGTMVDAATGVWYVVAYYTSATQITLQAQNLNSHPNHNTLPITNLLPLTFASGDGIEVVLPVIPITGFSSNCLMSNDTDTRVVAMQTNTVASGTYSSATYNVMKFSAVASDTHAAYSTSTGLYTCPVSGYYRCSASMTALISYTTADQGLLIAIAKNGGSATSTPDRFTAQIANTANTFDLNPSISTTIFCNAGDTLGPYIKCNISGSSFSAGGGCWFTVERLSGPSVIAATETVAMQINQASPTVTITGSYSNVKFTSAPTRDTHGGYSVSTGKYTCPTSGDYRCTGALQVNATFSGAGFGANAAIAKNGTVINGTAQISWGSGTVGLQPQCTATIFCNAGDTLELQTKCNGTTPTVGADATTNYLNIERVR